MEKDFKVIRGKVDDAVNVLREVALWGREAGLTVWKDENLTREKLMQGVNEEDFCVGQVDGANACCMIFPWVDRLFWPEAKPYEAGYVHKLCVRRAYSGNKLSLKLIEFAIAECRRKNVRYLRLDTRWDNKRLCSLYESYGFKITGKTTIESTEFALSQMEIR